MSINSIDDFLKHRGTEARGGGNFLNWKKDGRIYVWLHTKRLPIAVWQHRFPRKNVKDDKDTGESTTRFFNSPHVCWEDEGVLRRQYRRTREGEREAPPRRCPLCRTIETIRQSVENGSIAWTDPVFEFKGASDPDNDVTLHAGGITGAFGARDLGDAEKADLKKHGIYQTEAFKENCMAKLAYVFCVVDHEHPERGVQIATETSLLGDKVKNVINDEIASKEGDEGNPMVHPYAIELIYRDDKALAFSEKYKARRIERCKLTPEIEKLIRGEAPDLASQTKPFDAASMRATMEKYAVLDLPWDEIFDVEGEEDSPPPPPRKTVAKAKAPPPPSSKKITVPCETCKKPMDPDAAKCPSCGTEYEITDDEEEGPPDRELPLPPRKAAAAAAKGKKEAPPPPPPSSRAAIVDDEDDQIPF